MADDVRSGAGRRDEVGRSGIYPATGPYPDGEAPILTPGEINRDSGAGGSHVEQDDDLTDIERHPRLGNEDDKPDSDALGG